MSITPENLPRDELIGLRAEIIDSTDKTKVGISGEVIDETENLLQIEDKKVEKENCIFRFELPSGEKVKLNGSLINRSPEERIGMKMPNSNS